MEKKWTNEKLASFISNNGDSANNQKKLCEKLNEYTPNDRQNIINAKLPDRYNQTTIHIAARKGREHFLYILLFEYEGNMLGVK